MVVQPLVAEDEAPELELVVERHDRHRPPRVRRALEQSCRLAVGDDRRALEERRTRHVVRVGVRVDEMGDRSVGDFTDCREQPAAQRGWGIHERHAFGLDEEECLVRAVRHPMETILNLFDDISLLGVDRDPSCRFRKRHLDRRRRRNVVPDALVDALRVRALLVGELLVDTVVALPPEVRQLRFHHVSGFQPGATVDRGVPGR